MLDYNERLDQVQRLKVLKNRIQSKVSVGDMFYLREAFEAETETLLTELNHDSEEIKFATEWLHKYDEQFHEGDDEISD